MKNLINYLKSTTLLSKLVILVGLGFLAYLGKQGYEKYWPKKTVASAVIAVNDLPPLAYDKNANAPARPNPDTTTISDVVASQLELRGEIMGWNAQAGIAYANGGIKTMKGSIYEEQGVRLRLICQNSCSKQGEDVFTFAQDYANGNKNSAKGCHFIAWMGDAVPSYLQDLNERIKKQIGPDYILEPFGGFGASFGEDKAIFENGSFKNDPTKLLGSLWCGVIRDGDWNIMMQYCKMNNLAVNTDLTTYDPNAVNWMQAPDFDYTKAAQQYVARTPEKREIVIKGKRTGRDTTVKVNGVVTWFPGDQVAFTGRGGLTVASTKDFGVQMCNIWLAPKKWLQDNRAYVNKFIYGGWLGGDQVKSHASALTLACNIQQKIYGDASMSAKDWENAFKGISYTDAAGNINEIGGSRVFNMADAAEYFGLNGGTDKYNVVWTTFGDLCVHAYPKDVPTYPAYAETVDLSYMGEVYTKNKGANTSVASLPTFKPGSTMTSLVSKQSASIEFETGSDVISSKSNKILTELYNQTVISENLYVAIDGHTDNVGNPESNMTLSQKRAEAVKEWLVRKNPKLTSSITATGYGDTRPVNTNADNNNSSVRAKNRRVEIKFGR